MNMNRVKKAADIMVTTGMMSIFFCGSALTASAAQSGTAYVFIRDVAEDGVRYEGVDASVNTIKDGAVTADVSGDGSYTVSFDLSKESEFETVDEISMLKLYICGVDKTTGVSVTVDELRINDSAVTLSKEPTVQTSGNDCYLDICDTNGAELFNRTDYVKNITTIAIDFTVSGWPSEEETTAPETTTDAADTPKTTTASTTKTAQESSTPSTGDNGIISVSALLAAVAVLGGLAIKRK